MLNLTTLYPCLSVLIFRLNIFHTNLDSARNSKIFAKIFQRYGDAAWLKWLRYSWPLKMSSQNYWLKNSVLPYKAKIAKWQLSLSPGNSNVSKKNLCLFHKNCLPTLEFQGDRLSCHYAILALSGRTVNQCLYN